MLGKKIFLSLGSIQKLTIKSIIDASMHTSSSWRSVSCLSKAPKRGFQIPVQPSIGTQCCQFSISQVTYDVPPEHNRPYVDYHVPRVKFRKARRSRDPPNLAHEFPDIIRSWNLREILSDEEAKERHDKVAPEVIDRVNTQLRSGTVGRMFAVVALAGKQHFVKTHDIIVVTGHFPPNVGEVIKLGKVLVVGARDFSLFGRPLLPVDQAHVEATVVEKTMTHTKIWFHTVPSKNSRTWRFERDPLTYLRINNVSLVHAIDDLPDVRGVEGRVFGSDQAS